MEINVSKNLDELSKTVADWMVNYIQQTLKQQDGFTIALSGGNTPKKLHLLLSSDRYKDKIDWSRMHIFWGDERYVPYTDDRNNAKMAFDTLLNKVSVPPSQIYRIQTDISPAESALAYERILHQYFPKDKSFDLVLLGIGDNAHTLSLFPGYDTVHEKEKWVISVFLKEQDMYRITLTAPVVNSAASIIFLVSGTDKAEAIHHITGNEFNPDKYPAQIIKPVNGKLYYFLDEAAAKGLN
ncbi:MAG: 6-phosphogluconolactonase [Bacteroidetes bacterium]|nr:6-phosphogluconolactonase [Bacteroidota bacterium]